MTVPWIQMRTNLKRDPRVVAVATQLNVTRSCVVGSLYSLWALADEQTTNGKLVSHTFETIDIECELEGFARALSAVKPKPWLMQIDDGIAICEFAKWNGKSAKARALGARRSSRCRNAKRNGGALRDRHLHKRILNPPTSVRPPRAGRGGGAGKSAEAKRLIQSVAAYGPDAYRSARDRCIAANEKLANWGEVNDPAMWDLSLLKLVKAELERGRDGIKR